MLRFLILAAAVEEAGIISFFVAATVCIAFSTFFEISEFVLAGKIDVDGRSIALGAAFKNVISLLFSSFIMGVLIFFSPLLEIIN